MQGELARKPNTTGLRRGNPGNKGPVGRSRKAMLSLLAKLITEDKIEAIDAIAEGRVPKARMADAKKCGIAEKDVERPSYKDQALMLRALMDSAFENVTVQVPVSEVAYHTIQIALTYIPPGEHNEFMSELYNALKSHGVARIYNDIEKKIDIVIESKEPDEEVAAEPEATEAKGEPAPKTPRQKARAKPRTKPKPAPSKS